MPPRAKAFLANLKSIYFEDERSISRHRAKSLSSEIDKKSQQPDLKNKILPYVMARGLERYHMTGSVPEATETIMGRLEVASEQQESELSMLRYLVWAIPSIGFIGTVRGIGVALQRADEAIQGDIAGVTSALGVAFNSTLVALFISIVLMLLIHLLQSGQEGLILRLQTFCREQLIDKLFDQDPPRTECRIPSEACSGPKSKPKVVSELAQAPSRNPVSGGSAPSLSLLRPRNPSPKPSIPHPISRTPYPAHSAPRIPIPHPHPSRIPHPAPRILASRTPS